MYYSVRQIADILGVSNKQVYRLCKCGLEHYRIGRGVIRISPAQLEAFLNARKHAVDGVRECESRPVNPASLKHVKL